MALFTTNYEEIEEQDYSPLKTGEYEMVIASAKEKSTPNGKESFNIALIVRNDLKQVPELKEQNGKYSDRWVFSDEWKRDIKGRYIYKQENFMHYLDAAGVPEGTAIKDMEHLAQLLKGKPVRVYVKEEENTYNGETKMINTIAPWGFKKTKYPQLAHKFKDNKAEESNPFENASDPVDVKEDDLPF